MVGEERVVVGCLGGGRVQMVCEEPRRDRVCVGGGRVQKFIIMLMQIIRTTL